MHQLHNRIKFVLGLKNPLSLICTNPVDAALGLLKNRYDDVIAVSKNGYITTFNIGSCKLL